MQLMRPTSLVWLTLCVQFGVLAGHALEMVYIGRMSSARTDGRIYRPRVLHCRGCLDALGGVLYCGRLEGW